MRNRNVCIAMALLLGWAGAQDPAATAGAAQPSVPAQDSAPASAQATPPAAAAADAPALLSTSELDTLLGPIALYPDPLIAQILPASTYPMDIIKAARFVAKEKDETKLDSQDWDPAVIAVAHYPSVIKMMSDDIDWTQQLGAAFLDQQEDVMKSIQRLRAQAEAVGSLKTTEQQKVIVEQSIIRIEPVNPQIIYVPVYSPQVVYVARPVYSPAPFMTFAAGVVVGAWFVNTSCNWHGGFVYWGGGHHHGNYYKGGNTKINIDNSKNINIGSGNTNIGGGNRNTTLPASGEGGRWSRDNSRGSAPTTTRNPASGAARPTMRPAAGTGAAGARPATGAVGAADVRGRPATGAVNAGSARPTPGGAGAASTGGARPSQGGASASGAGPGRGAFNQPSTGAATRDAANRGVESRQGVGAGSTGANRTGSGAGAAQRPAPSTGGGGGGASANRGSAFGNSGQNSAATRGASQRGAASRGGGGRR